ncbi:hypothetical protein J3A83DRAFT_4223148 [Scleroderma citrinum]
MASDPSLSTVERLILAQAVYEFGADAWPTVSKVVSKHPALARPNQFFSPQSCQAIYTRLLHDASLEWSDANKMPHAPLNLKLAQRHYLTRLLELRDLIAAEEAKFKRLFTEINEIRSGGWDEKIRAKLTGEASELNLVTPPEEQPSPAQGDQEPGGQDASMLHTHSPSEILHTEEREHSPRDIAYEIPDTNPDQVEIIVVEDLTNMPSEPSPNDAMEVDEAIPVEESATTADGEEPAAVRSPEAIISLEMASPREDQNLGKRKVSDTENLDDSARDKKKPREQSASTDIDEQALEAQSVETPGAQPPSESAVGSSSRRRGTTGSEHGPHAQVPAVLNKRFQTVIGMLHSQISQHRNGNIFHNPIKSSEAPDYHEIIKRPMDLKTIKARVKDGVITNSLEFQRDVYLMFANAMMYNRPGSDIYQMAEEVSFSISSGCALAIYICL